MNHCKNCNSDFNKKYCNNCGQKLFTKEDKSIKNLIEELVHFLTHFEGTFFTTLKTLFLHPSKLTNDYCNGIRKKYFKPISLYLLVVIIYLLMPLASGLNMKMNDYNSNFFGIISLDTQIENKISELNISKDELAIKFEAKSEKTAKFLLFIMIPLSTIIILLLFFKEKRLVYDTFILSTEINTFFISIYFLLFPIVFLALSHLFSIKDNLDNIFVISFYMITFFLYIYTLFHRFYHQKKIITIAKALVFVFLYITFIIPFYRFLVFETTLMLL